MNSSRKATHPKQRFLIIALLCCTVFVADIADRAMADCAPSANGLVAWWSGDANATDLIGTNHGTLQGGATANSAGLVGNGFNFDGTSGFVSIPDSPALRPTNFTIEAWVKVDTMNTPSTANAGVQFYVFKQNSRASFFEGYWLGKSRSTGTDTFVFGVSSAAGVFVAVRSATIQTGVWYHVAAVRGSNYLQIYTNGVLSAQATVTFPQDYGNQPLYLGSSGVPSYDSKLKGNLDEVSLYNRPLSSNEIATVFAAGAAGRCKSPIISLQPQGQTAVVGNTVNFTTAATGFAPLSYQWRLNDSPILGATNSSLTLSNVLPPSQGNYSVLVSNAISSVLSSNAWLEVSAPVPGVPYIAGFNPVVARPGQNVSISGFNFSPVAASNIVRFGAVHAEVIAASATNLTVTVPIGATYAPISLTVTGLTAFARSSFLPTFNGDGQPISGATFALRQDITTGYGNFQTHIADFDGDGKPDLVIGNGGTHTISFYRNIGGVGSLSAGSFAAPVVFTVPGSLDGPGGLASADLDGDGKLELFYTDPSSNRVGIMRNLSEPGILTSNSFAAPLYVATALGGKYVRAGDLDGDGRPDLVACNYGDPANATISVIRNQSSPGALVAGSFAPAVNIPMYNGPHDLVIQDFDGDGKPDVVTAHAASSILTFFRNISTPGSLTAESFAPRVELPAVLDQLCITAGDVDGDGKADIIVGGKWYDIYVYRNQSSPGSLGFGSFAAPVTFGNPGWVHNVVLGDINGDGKPDIVAVGELNSFLCVYQNKSTPGSFTTSSLAPRVDFGTGWNAWGLSVSDLDGDMRPDAAFCNQYEAFSSLYRNNQSFGGPPFIMSQPANQSTPVGASTQFFASVGGQSPLAYQWFLNGARLSDSASVSGSLSNVLTLTGTLTNNIGSYWLVATNTLGAITSAVVTLNVGFPPVITTQPVSQTNQSGSSAEFIVTTASNPTLQYQWRFNGTNLPGATASNLFFATVQSANEGNYSVVITNNYGAITSALVFLRVYEPPDITSQPQSATVFAGNDASFAANVTGSTPMNFQWLFNGTPLVEGGRFLGTTQTSLTILNAQTSDAGNYQLMVTNSFSSATSSVAALTVNLPVCAPVGSGLLAWWSADSSTYDQKGGNLIQLVNGAAFTSGKVVDGFLFDGVNDYISVTTSSNLNVGLGAGVTFETWLKPSNLTMQVVAEWNGGAHLWLSVDTVVAGDGVGNIYANLVDSNNVTHYLVAPSGVMKTNSFQHIALTYDKTSGVAAIYRNGVALITTNIGVFTLKTDGTLTFGTRTSGPFTGTYFKGAMDEILIYNRALTPTEIKAGYDASYVGHCPLPPVVVLQPQSQTVFVGTNLILSANALGSFEMTYQWFFNGNPLTNGNGYYWVTSPTLTISNAQAVHAGNYYLTFSNIAGTAQSDVATLTVTPVPATIVQQPASVTATKGAQVTLSAVATSSETLVYQWFFNSNVLAGATGDSITFTNVQFTNAGAYALVVTNDFSFATSSTATLTVTPPPGFLWTRKAGGLNADEGRSVAMDAQGNIYVAGHFVTNANFSGTNLPGFGATDLFVAKYDPLGQMIWVRSAGSFSGDSVNGIAVDAGGNVFIVGNVANLPNFSGITLTNFGGTDAFAAKYSSAGDLLWATNFGGTSTDSANAIAIDNAGRIFVTGSFNGTGFFGGTIISNTLNGAAFVARFSADGDAEWVRASAGTSTASGNGIAVDTQGKVIIAGSFNFNVAAFGSFPLTNFVLNGVAASPDIFIVKYDANGNVLWAQKTGGPGIDTARGIAVDGGGSSYIVGEFNGTATFGSTTLVAAQSTDVFLIKCDPIGNIQWAQRAGGTTSTDAGNGVSVDAGGNVFITGNYAGTGNFGGVYFVSSPNGASGFIGGTNLSNSGNTDAFVAMYTTAGELRWALKAGGTSTDAGRTLLADNSGSLFVSGAFSTTTQFGHQTNISTGGTDFFLSKLAAFDTDAPAALIAQPDRQTNAAGSTITLVAGVLAPGPITYQWQFNGANIPGATNLSLTLANLIATNSGGYAVNITTPNGNLSTTSAVLTVLTEPDFLWAKHFGGTNNDECLAVAADANGNTYAAGYFSGTTAFGGTNLTSNGGEDGFVAKFDASQNLVWLWQLGGTNHDRANALALDSNGNVIVAGQFSDIVDFGVPQGGITSFGSNDVFLAKFDAAGTLIWARQAGNTHSDFARSVAVHTNGDIAVAGQFQLNAVFEGVTVTNRNTSGWDVFVARYDSSGQLLWVQGAGGNTTPHDDRVRGVAFDPSGNVMMCGSFLYGINFGSVSLNNNRAAQEIFMAKYSPTGGVLWARSSTITLQTPQSVDDEAMAVASDRDGNIFFTGYFQNQITMASNTIFAANTNVPDLFLARYDANGNALWLRTGGGVATDSALALATDNSGNALLAGSFTGPAQFGLQTLTGIGGSDAFAAMYDATGNLVKLRRLGGMGDDAAQAAAYDGRGNLVLGGFHTGAAVVGNTPLPGDGGRDAFVSKLSLYDPDLAPLITTQPLEQTVGYGKILDLAVGVTSGSPPSYQWLFNNAPLSGATNGSLRITNFQYAAVGNYSVIVTNGFGAVTSSVATVTVEIFPEFPWLQRAGSTGDDQAFALATDSQTNLYMAGYFTGTALFTNGIYGTNISLISTGLTDIFLTKHNAAGKLLWARRAGGSSEESANALAVDAAGSVLLTGHFRSTQAKFGSLDITNPSPNLNLDIFVAKYDSEGNPLWAKSAGGIGNDVGRSIATDAEGNAYVTGFSYRTATFGDVSITNAFTEFPTNFFIAKYNSDGQTVWVRNAIATTLATVQGAAVTIDMNHTNVIVTGHFTGAVNFGSGFLTNNSSTSEGGSVFLTKYDQTGNLLWAKKGISGAAGIGLAIRNDSSGNIYATSHRPSFSGTPAIVLTKYDSNGFPIWTRGVAQGNGQLQASSLALDTDGNIFMVGAVSAGSLTFEGTQLSVGSGFVTKYRPDGAPLWVTLAGAWCYGVVPDNTGGAYLAGRFSSQGAFGSSKTNFLTAIGGNDIFLVKLGVKSPTATPQAFVKTIATDAGTTLQVTTTGTGPFAYQWRFNGTNILGATGSTYLLNGAKWTNAGLYTVAISNTAGSFVSAPAAVNVTPKLYSEPSGADVKLTWGGQFTLQSSTNPAGPFTDLPGVVSPHFYPTSNDPLRFFRLKSEPFALSISNQPGMGLTLSGAGISGYNFILLGSTNLVNWTPLGTNISPFSFTEMNPQPMRFYRAVMAQ